ncbi:hypothetical protein CAter10_2312 [Collimonas arenae]|uniref:hypothetical protein n=1 Tax=Collimonas arenae TaxID=279058 RepID=UPI00078D85BC|nr:hypothetical protein [Collimonas arenae]AMO99983.1 hypothetical protein CAter10_2312 [Collimonas arenae]
MKKLLGIAAVLLAFTPFAQAQNMDNPLAGHPDARNDRTPQSYEGRTVEHKKHDRHHEKAKKHHHVEEKK